MYIPEDKALLADLKLSEAAREALREFVRAYNVHLRAVLDNLKDAPQEERRALVAHLAQFMMGASAGSLIHIGWTPKQLAVFVEEQARVIAEHVESQPRDVPEPPSTAPEVQGSVHDTVPPTDPAPVVSELRPSARPPTDSDPVSDPTSRDP